MSFGHRFGLSICLFLASFTGITETGVDVVAPAGWKNHFTEEQYLEQLKWYDGVLRKDDYVLGATILALEIPGWFSFDIALIVDRLAAHVAASR